LQPSAFSRFIYERPADITSFPAAAAAAAARRLTAEQQLHVRCSSCSMHGVQQPGDAWDSFYSRTDSVARWVVFSSIILWVSVGDCQRDNS